MIEKEIKLLQRSSHSQTQMWMSWNNDIKKKKSLITIPRIY